MKKNFKWHNYKIWEHQNHAFSEIKVPNHTFLCSWGGIIKNHLYLFKVDDWNLLTTFKDLFQKLTKVHHMHLPKKRYILKVQKIALVPLQWQEIIEFGTFLCVCKYLTILHKDQSQSQAVRVTSHQLEDLLCQRSMSLYVVW